MDDIKYIEGLLTENELSLAEKCLSYATEHGAQKARICLCKSVTDLYGTLNGSLDKVTHCLDRSMDINLFVDGRFGSFSTNKLDEENIKSLIDKSIKMVKMLAEDQCRDLPDPKLTAKDAITGRELDLFDSEYSSMTSEKRLKMALDAAITGKISPEGCKLISEEGEYSDSISDSYLIDSNGLKCRESITSFDYGVEITVEDSESNKLSGYWWDSRSKLSDLDLSQCGKIALDRAKSQIGSKVIESGKYNIVIRSECASRVVMPILNALNAYSLQQNNSFLQDSLGKQVFPEGLTMIDDCHKKGGAGSRLFDSEGLATKERIIIDKGVVNTYFVNTYMSNKMGINPTNDEATRPLIKPYISKKFNTDFEGKLDETEILKLCGDGILITGFNGGNSNSATGNFSFGIEGFLFKSGKIVHPVREMLLTSDFLTLWSNFLAAGEDYRECMSKLIPTLAFGNADISA